MLTVHVAPVAFAVLASLSAADERTTRASGRQIESLVEGKRFEAIAAVDALPPPVKDELARLMGQDALTMADPGQPFQATDEIEPGRTLPGRRLILAGHAGDLVVVHYETGGYAHTYSLVVFRLSGGVAEAVAAARTKGALPDLAALQAVRHSILPGEAPFRY